MEQNQNLPSPGSVLALGIIGLATCGSGIIGLIFSIIAISKAGKFRKGSTIVSKQVNIGRTLGILGLVFSILMIVVWIVLAATGAFQSY